MYFMSGRVIVWSPFDYRGGLLFGVLCFVKAPHTNRQSHFILDLKACFLFFNLAAREISGFISVLWSRCVDVLIEEIPNAPSQHGLSPPSAPRGILFSLPQFSHHLS